MPHRLYEAASVDRAGTMQKHSNVTLPVLNQPLFLYPLRQSLIVFRQLHKLPMTRSKLCLKSASFLLMLPAFMMFPTFSTLPVLLSQILRLTKWYSSIIPYKSGKNIQIHPKSNHTAMLKTPAFRASGKPQKLD